LNSLKWTLLFLPLQNDLSALPGALVCPTPLASPAVSVEWAVLKKERQAKEGYKEKKKFVIALFASLVTNVPPGCSCPC
jgi:hypothetical protein